MKPTIAEDPAFIRAFAKHLQNERKDYIEKGEYESAVKTAEAIYMMTLILEELEENRDAR